MGIDIEDESTGRRFVLISAAYNEEKNIEKTIGSVLNQTIFPEEWIIVSDGSTDATDRIVESYSARYPFMRLLRVDRQGGHSFGAKVRAINYALPRLLTRSYEYLGILDTDISFEPLYFSEILCRFAEDASLGIAGGNIVQYVDGSIERRIKTMNSVAGAVQLFRKECFLETDGFIPMEYGGEDAAIEITARMNGWKVRTFAELEVVHYGFVGRGAGSRIKARFKNGGMCYALGYHPLFQILRLLFRTIEKPYVIGSVVEMAGFLNARRLLKKPMLKPEVFGYLRKEQLERMHSLLSLKSTGLSG